MTMPLLEIDRLSLQVRARPSELDEHDLLVQGVSVRVDAGSITGVVGESGSGKTLTALASIGLLPPAITCVEGSIRIKGNAYITVASFASSLEQLPIIKFALASYIIMCDY